MEIKVQYFASLRDSTLVPEEIIETDAQTLLELYNQLEKKYTFNIEPKYLRASRNDEYVEFDISLHDLDSILLIPPVSGG